MHACLQKPNDTTTWNLQIFNFFNEQKFEKIKIEIFFKLFLKFLIYFFLKMK